MTMVHITQLAPRSDVRGSSYTLQLPFERIAESHIATVEPGHVRGNHFHRDGREMLIVLARERFTIFFDRGEKTPVETQVFDGGAVQADFEPGSAHAIRNDGSVPLQIFVIADARRNPAEPDTFPRKLV